MYPGEYDGIFAAQRGKCARCSLAETRIGPGGQVRLLNIVVTGTDTRALVCSRCNDRYYLPLAAYVAAHGPKGTDDD